MKNRNYEFETTNLSQMNGKDLLYTECHSDIESVRDFGGYWEANHGINGRYFIKCVQHFNAKFGELIDGGIPDVRQFPNVERIRSIYPDSTIKLTKADFRDPQLYVHMEPVDIALVYCVLLHQENVVEVIRNMTKTTKQFICVAQPFLKEEVVKYPHTAINLYSLPKEHKIDLGLDNLDESWSKNEFQNYKLGWRLPSTSYWVWGHTIACMNSIFESLGWTIDKLSINPNAYGELTDKWEFGFIRYKKMVKNSNESDDYYKHFSA